MISNQYNQREALLTRPETCRRYVAKASGEDSGGSTPCFGRDDHSSTSSSSSGIGVDANPKPTPAPSTAAAAPDEGAAEPAGREGAAAPATEPGGEGGTVGGEAGRSFQ